jgi:hypothetical protein
MSNQLPQGPAVSGTIPLAGPWDLYKPAQQQAEGPWTAYQQAPTALPPMTRPVTDPAILAQLNGTPVTDPRLLAQLNGTQSQAPDNSTVGAPGTTFRGPYGQYTIPQPTQQAAPNALESFGHGMERTADGVHQAFLELKAHLSNPTLSSTVTGKTEAQGDLEKFTRQLNNEEGDYQKGRGPKPGIDWPSLGGSAVMSAPLMFLPGGGATVLGRAGAGALAGGIDAAAQPTETGSTKDRLVNTLVGAGTGGVAAPVAGAAGDKLVGALNTVRGRTAGVVANVAGRNTEARVLQEAPEIASIPAGATLPTGQTGAEAQRDLIAEGQKMITATGKLDAAALARKANLLANNLQPTASMVSRDPAQWTRERNLQKLAQSPDEQLSQTGNQLSRVYEGNDAALSQGLQTQRAPFGGGTQEGRGMVIMNGADALAKQSQKDVSTVYQAVKDARGADLASDGRNLHDTIKALADSPAADPIVDAAKRKMKTLGMLDAEGNLTNNTMTVSQAEGLRQHISAEPLSYGKKQLLGAIDSDVIGGLGDDAFSGARAAAKQRFDMLRNPATQRALDNIGELTQGKTAQGFIRNNVINAPEQDVASLLATIKQMPADSQEASLAAMRGGLMDHLYDAAINPNSGKFSGAKLGDAMRDIDAGGSKIEMILGPQATAKLRSLQKAALDATYEPPYSAVNHSNTTPMLLSLTQQARAIPGVPLIANENLEKMAAHSGYAGQLADALKAKAAMPEVGIPKSLQKRLAQALAQGVAPSAAQGAYSLRQPQQQ